MDFSYLLELAKANEEHNKKEASTQRFSTNVSTAKKVEKGPNNEGVKAFLDRKEAKVNEERKKYAKDRDELFARRAQDKGSRKRVAAMIKRTKGASKAVLDDAKDLITEKGDSQCDEDDYGYESTMSQQIFSKLKTQYSETPEDQRLKFKKTEKRNIDDIKLRVINSLKVDEEKDLGIRKRTRNRKSRHTEFDPFINDEDEYKRFDDSPKEKRDDSSHSDSKFKKAGKSSEHKSEKHLKKNRHKEEHGRKERHKEEHGRKERHKEEKEKSRKKKEEKRKRKLNLKTAPPPLSFNELLNVAKKKQKEPIPTFVKPVEPIVKEKDLLESDRPMTAKERQEFEEERLRKLRRMGKLPPEKMKIQQPQKENKHKEQQQLHPKDPKHNFKLAPSSNATNSQTYGQERKQLSENSKYFSAGKSTEKSEVVKPQKELKKTLPTTLNKEKKKSYPKIDMPPSKLKAHLQRPMAPTSKRKIEDSDEEEYDSEMDDFIDDGGGGENYSDVIKGIFGYDKSKYSNIDEDDVDDMEVSYSQVQKEEKMSAKLGLMEDLEDIKREEDEKKYKKMRQLEKLKVKKRK